MNSDSFLKYNIRKGDTLTLLGKRLAMHPIDLKFFHNGLCSHHERIYFDDLSYYEFIYVPIKKLAKKDRSKERPAPVFSPSLYFPTYSVQERFNHQNQEEFTIDYKVELTFDKNEDGNIVSIQRNDFKKNHLPPEDKISSLTIAITKLLSPFSFNLSQKGEIVSIADEKAIDNRFSFHRKQIEELYIGEVSNLYLDMLEASLNNKPYFLNQIKKTPLFRLLFPKLDWFHKTSPWQEIVFEDQKKPTPFQLSADYLHDDKNTVQTIIYGENKEDNRFTFNYKTSKIDKKLIEIKADITTRDMLHQLKITPFT